MASRWLLLLEEVLRQVGRCELQRCPVERPSHHSTDEGPQSRGMPAATSPHRQPLHNLKLHCSIEGKSPPDHDGASSTVPRISSGISLSCQSPTGKFVAWEETLPLKMFFVL
ncbi:upstream stimulatory factor 1 isoform X1 [Lates japonicus]|uniref:Upstream stimulatory factor 1 isoform X1 n=1 Tax=Lates japonicus TaxID=270547 RepID=A0AAD3MCU8_LATJO|nr:upstream stimulatory factor 1 isoform X1 [Lates japonicus]